VSLLSPQKGSGHNWRIAFIDPDTAKQKREAIPDHHTRTAELRDDYCVRKSEELKRRRYALDRGAVPKSSTPILEAAQGWLATYPDPRTRETYGESCQAFVEWAADRGIKTFDDVSKGTLKSFRDDLYTDELQATTLNKKLRSLRTFLVWVIDSELAPKLHTDDLSALKKWKEKVELRAYLDPQQVQKVFEAVERHDNDCHAMTRDEKTEGRRRRRGSTPKFDPLMPLLVLISLSGLRLKEAVQLTWEHFDADKLDVDRKTIGELYVPATIAKTKKARRIPLDHSPALRRYLIQRKLQTGGEGTIAGVTYDQAAKGLKRIRAIYGAPSTFSWQAMRRTVSTFLTSAPNIFGAASHALSASRLGHSWKIAEAHYADDAAGISADARTLEDALGIADLVSHAAPGTASAAGNGESTFFLSG
jgi:site-specific recombinase XerD